MIISDSMISDSIISEDQVRSVLTYPQLLFAMKFALIELWKGNVQQPVRSVLRLTEHNGWLGMMPAVYQDVIGIKLVTLFPGNATRGIPTHLATIQLLRASTGERLAVLDGRLITEMRTAAVSAVATARLTRPTVHTLAILGSGVQARAHAEALRLVRDFKQVRVWSPTRENARRCADEIGAVMAESAEDAVRDADVIVTVTSSDEPVLRGEWLKPGAYVNAVGAVGPTRRELDDVAMHASVVVESREAAMRESGDILLSGASIEAELGELLADPDRQLPEGRIVFKSLGVAAEDLVAACLVYDAVSHRARQASSRPEIAR